ncbi:spermatid-specific heat shock protein 70-like protein [Leptotrombidium deliense]|uniref:Spermatid-specific heat shock protein 70-like protein n=1 Tax=Leptotrombidium deliense TaxID=299467 RepID=A0A443S3N8_9ACAR|nr:spermatid-specific heat shock protein 70-like protein [Leptotrombidium deliense]
MATPTENTIGIDLGTTHACVAVYRKGKIEILSNDYSERTTTSYVTFTEHKRLIAVETNAMVGEDPQNTVFDAKRRKLNDPTITAEKKN